MPSLADAVVTGVLGEAVLRDGDAVVREVAALALLRVAVALRMLGGAARPAIAALSTALSRDQSAIVRKLCAWALGTIWAAGEGDDPADSSESDSHLLLAETLASDPDPHVRRNAADALGRIGGDAAAARLTDALGSDADARVRRHAAHALGLSPSPPALADTATSGGGEPTLSARGFSATLRTDSSALTRKLAADALGELLVDNVSVAEMELGITALTAALADDMHSKVRKHCAWALAKAWPACSGNGAAPASLAPAVHQLAVVLVDDHNQRVRSHAAETLGRLGADAAPAVAALVVALGDQSRRVRVRVAEALGMVGTAARPAAKQLASTCLEDCDPGVRGNAVQSLAGLLGGAPDCGDGDRSAAAAVTRLANALCAASLADGAAPAGMIPAADAAHSRERAAVALRKMGGAARPASAALATALGRDESAIVRKHCAWALGTVWAAGEGDALLLAQTLTLDRDPDVRRNAANALGRIGGDSAVRWLTDALGSDRDAGVRRHATQVRKTSRWPRSCANFSLL
jgi:HEAT repeat protein